MADDIVVGDIAVADNIARGIAVGIYLAFLTFVRSYKQRG